METMNKHFTRKELSLHVNKLLEERGVSIREISEIVRETQLPYNPALTLEECDVTIQGILTKREVQNALMTAIELDKLAEEDKISDPYLLAMLKTDDGLYGIDEVIPMGIVNLYGTIGYTTFGYLDKLKPGIIGHLDKHNEDGRVHTFLDDIVCAIAASACSRIAHHQRDIQNNEETY